MTACSWEGRVHHERQCSARVVSCHRATRGSEDLMCMQDVLIVMMTQPGGGKAFPALLPQYLIHEPMVFRGIPRNAIQDEAAERQREGPLPHFPQLVIGVTLGPHDRHLVNGGIFQANAPVRS